MSECVSIETELVTTSESVATLEFVELAIPGPPGPPGRDGFTVAIDVISGGAPDTDYSDGYIFSGGTP